MSGKRVLVVGEINPDLVMSGYRAVPVAGREVLVEDANLALGSASVICAVGLARLGNQVAFLGKLGLTPADRSKVSAAKPKPNANPLDEFKAAG